ncbi:MAG: class I SAM-dependent methyltransferase [Deltaproteobacteria bacterium]|nr:class I SAM-dependent methyltransferase [Deltaproteobacteria bacterium]MBW2120762.1 class I SAM-dependent methyltransferase [Deltaproteobacteria bacterium]
MDISDIERLNVLWLRIYPYLAAQVIGILPEKAGIILEVGPFSGGIGFELAREKRDSSVVIADSHEEILGYLKAETARLKLPGRVDLVRSDPSRLGFKSGVFSGVVFRGAFFFLDSSMLREIDRVLEPGGVGFIGGGFGAGTPPDLIREISLESRILNERLGKRRISRGELEDMAASSGLQGHCRITERGGLWLILQK